MEMYVQSKVTFWLNRGAELRGRVSLNDHVVLGVIGCNDCY